MTHLPHLNVIYTCHGCGIREREVPVLKRGKDQDVDDWMRYVQGIVGADHFHMSPTCSSRECDLKIPMINKDARIGAARRQ